MATDPHEALERLLAERECERLFIPTWLRRNDRSLTDVPGAGWSYQVPLGLPSVTPACGGCATGTGG